MRARHVWRAFRVYENFPDYGAAADLLVATTGAEGDAVGSGCGLLRSQRTGVVRVGIAIGQAGGDRHLRLRQSKHGAGGPSNDGGNTRRACVRGGTALLDARAGAGQCGAGSLRRIQELIRARRQVRF